MNETLEFAGDFSTEHKKLEGREYRINKHIDVILETLETLSTAWVDAESEKYITSWKTTCNEIKTETSKAITDAKAALDEYAKILLS